MGSDGSNLGSHPVNEFLLGDVFDDHHRADELFLGYLPDGRQEEAEIFIAQFDFFDVDRFAFLDVKTQGLGKIHLF